MFFYEIHCHSNACSKCGCADPKAIALSYKAAGYSGLVITEHCARGNTSVNRNLPWSEQVDAFWNSYIETKNACEDQNFSVFFGLEYNYGEGKEALLFGIDKDFLLAFEDFNTAPIEEVSKRVREYGGVIIAAHPMRSRSYIPHLNEPDMSLFDGMEKYNYCDTKEDFERELALAEKHPDVIFTAGSDWHSEIDELKAGIATEHKLEDVKHLAQTLKNGTFKPFCKGKCPFGDIK